MKILVTGGAGFIGSSVVDRYVSLGHGVSVVDDLSSGREENINPGARFYRMDIRDPGLAGVIERERPEVLNHHAAQISVPASVDDPINDAEVNILGLLNVLKCAVRFGVGKVIFISSGGAIYGESAEVPVPETHTPEPLSPYAISKFVSEHYLAFYHRTHGLHYVSLRYSNIYGPRQIPQGEAGVVAIFMDQLLKGQVPTLNRFPDGPDGMTRDYCFVGDVARANELALDRGDGLALNVGTGVETTTGELYRKILSQMREAGHALDRRFDEPMSALARPGDLRRSALWTEEAAQVLGWSAAHQLAEGVAETLAWRLGRPA